MDVTVAPRMNMAKIEYAHGSLYKIRTYIRPREVSIRYNLASKEFFYVGLFDYSFVLLGVFLVGLSNYRFTFKKLLFLSLKIRGTQTICWLMFLTIWLNILIIKKYYIKDSRTTLDHPMKSKISCNIFFIICIICIHISWYKRIN